jgi:predicted dienelactone hydrolase
MKTERLAYTDTTRRIRASMGFAGARERRIDALAWRPPTSAPWPLVIYCHGTDGSAGNATWLAKVLTKAGYLVVAPFFPLTSNVAHTRVLRPDISDAGEQVRDVCFLIDALLADPEWGSQIDASRIGTVGHSLGAITCWFASFGAKTRDPRIVATAMLGADDPIVAAGTTDLGLAEAGQADVTVPVLLVTAEKDLFSRMMGPHGTAFPRLNAPKFEVTIAGGCHVWFHDGDTWPPDHSNPDALWFAARSPGFVVPGSEDREPLIGPDRQREITGTAVLAFFARFLNEDPGGLTELEELTKFSEVQLNASVAN